MRKTLFILTTMTLVAAGGGRALAGGAPVVNETRHVSNETETSSDVDPCTSDPIKLTITYSGVEHFVLQSDGTAHFTDTSVGTFSFDRKPTDGVADATGRFTVWDGGNGLFDRHGNPIGRTEVSFTLNGSGTRADGTSFQFHNNAHMMTNDVGDVTLAFFKAHCG